MSVSETFPSWFIGKNPDRRVIEVSYGDALAKRFGRLNRRKIEEFGKALWNIETSHDNASVTDWGIHKKDGGMISAGIGAGISGFGADLLLLDDLIKNKQEADSITYRDMVWGEWQNTLVTRLHPNAAIILILTRWHEDDIAGRILATEAEKWTVVKLPAVAEENDLLGRKLGEPLWPEHGFDLAWAIDKKKEVGTQTWNALYQQRPSPQEGGIYKRQWWKYYTVLPADLEEIVLSMDASFKDEAAASGDVDYVALQAWGRIGANKFLLDQIRAKMNYPDTVKAFRNFAYKWQKAKAKLIEDKANGPAIIATLKNEIAGIIAVEPQGSKSARYAASSPQVEAGNVYLPDPAIAPWIHDFVEELADAPNGKYDDQADAAAQALLYFEREKKQGGSVSSFTTLSI